ncbi:MAG TPA: FtsX-like permease family protein [Puia sp.]|nr:FtsX-like permease family protein [Puia sp.]
MPEYFLKTAARGFLRNKTQSLIHILGLSTGIAACLFIYGYVHNELTYDAYNTRAGRIVRVTMVLHAPESNMAFATSPTPLAGALQRDIPGIVATTRIEPTELVIREGTEYSRSADFCFSEPSVFSVLSFSFLEGTPANALSEPNSIVLTRSMEKRYFGHDRALGRTLICNDHPWLVTGVIADRPPNSDLPINALLSKDYTRMTAWMDDLSVYTFALFQDKPDCTGLKPKLSQIARYSRPELDSAGATGYSLAFEAEPLTGTHFSKAKLQDTAKGNRAFNTIFSWLAAFILLLALLNYINLSTARATERAKEVGVRKAIGARPLQLIRQFLGESFFLLTLAWLLAIALVMAGAPLFNRLLSIHLALTDGPAILFLVLLFPVTGLLAGGYPALVLSRFNPIKALKGETGRQQGTGLRKALTVIQFVIALVMLTGTAIIYSQMQYIRRKDPGMDRSHIACINLPGDSAKRKADTAFCDALRRQSGIRGISVGSGMPTEGIAMGTTIASANGKKRELMCNYFYIDQQFLPLFHMSLAAGRNLADSLSTDRTEAFLVNEAFVKEMGWRSPLGQSIEGFNHKGRIVGVVRNFFYKSIHNTIEPAVLIYNTFPLAAAMVSISPRELPRLKQLWKQYFPSSPFNYYFMDENFDAQYAKDRMTMLLFNVFTGLALFISFIGLYGLVSLILLQRKKEIGIRKVLGATPTQLLTLLTKHLLLLLAVATAIALPLAGIAGSRWLASYAYHTNLSLWIFLWSPAVILLLTLAVTGSRIFRASLANPVGALRSE